ncbi:unnamed protein product [Brachionus calyciflorus]|uniref:Rab-GAP TBC domain-containing protein n=1 Tax=Brachionus calyciflorus TaxID=104777 RepID=A0A813SKH4_9BILA|nr:unnamed protein product [Brachionus calyciflorus]
MAKRLANGTEEDYKRIERDRQEINAAYDNGYSNDVNDPELNSAELQDRIDKYGFIHNSKLPPQLTETELKRNNIEKLREQKWRSMIKEWPKHYSSNKQKYSDKLVSRIFKGIPNSMRNAAWQKLLEIEVQIKAQAGVYEKMKTFARKYSLELRQIDLDINRTFRNNYAYKKRYCQRQKQLYNVLAAYSVYNTEIGYCQGMSTLTAALLMYISDEEQTFWALSQLMSSSKYSMHGLFKTGFPKLIRFSDKHEMIIKTFLPKLHKKFIKCNITPLIYTTKWFLQCFLDSLPFSLVLRVWDVYLLKGDIAILAMSYCILKMHKRTLLQKEFDMDKINEFLNHKLPENFLFSDDIVMEKLNDCIEKLLRYKFESPLIEPIPQNELPNVPFGDFKQLDYQEIINKLVENNTKKMSIEEDRDEQLKQIAKTRLETEQLKREENRKKRLEEKKLTGDKLDINTDDDDSDEDNLDSDDDLNPSKLSEYDDDKVDIESMISNMTRQSSPHRSINSFDIPLNNKLNSKNSASSNSFNNQASDYENLKERKSYLNPSLASPLKYSSNSLHKSSPKHKQLTINAKTSSSSALISHIISPNNSRLSQNSIPSSKSYINNTASIMSNPQLSPALLNKLNYESNPSNIATIKTNPDYYNNNNNNSNSARILSTGKINEYVRSPHGIYTRVNVPPNNYKPTQNNVSSVTTQSKRTSSLRSVQKGQMSQMEYFKSSSNVLSYTSPTKQNLQNHSLRIANIQQNNEIKSPTKNYSVIGQGPKRESLNNHVSRLDISPGKNIVSRKSNETNKSDMIEQYDYI